MQAPRVGQESDADLSEAAQEPHLDEPSKGQIMPEWRDDHQKACDFRVKKGGKRVSKASIPQELHSVSPSCE